MPTVNKNRFIPIVLILDIIIMIIIYQKTTQRQDFLLAGLSVQIILGFVVFIWFLFFSGFPKKLRLMGLGAVVLLGLLASVSLKIDDYSGDMIPIPVWRWKPKADEVLDREIKTAEARAEEKIRYAFPGFLGPNGDGRVLDLKLARNWEETPPKERWRQKIGAGWSGASATEDVVVTQEQRANDEMVTCYSLKDGSLIWSHSDQSRFTSSLGGDGPRSTPALAGGMVYTMGALGLINCLNLTTGEPVWSVDTVKKYGAVSPAWGFSCSPLVLDDKVIISIGGSKNRSLIALDPMTGAYLWGGGSDTVGYSSPHLHTLAGVPQIVILNGNTVAGHNPDNGALLWEQPWGQGKPNVANPLGLAGDRLLVSSGYGVGAKLFSFTAEGEELKVTETYESRRLKAKFSNFVQYNGAVYGLDDGVLTCINPDDGERLWKGGRYGHGQMLLVGDLLLVQGESGELNLIEPNPEEHRELGQISVLGNKSWNNMALSGNLLIMRNHKEIVCLELPTMTH